MCHITGKLLTWRLQMVNLSLIGHTQVKLHHLKHQNLKHVEIIKFSDNHTYDISLESSSLGDQRF